MFRKKPSRAYRRVTASSDVDQLAGADLRASDVVFVLWPDGSETEERVRIERVGENGRRAYVETRVRGAFARVYLRHDGIKCCPKV